MIFFVTVLRALAAILITNSHYVGVYPTDLIANGGLLGDVLFFSVSGFVLINIKTNFFNWYQKRLVRIYPTIWIITIIYLLFGFYTFESWTIKEYFLYPTYYHFIASIVVLYIPYFIIVRNKKMMNNILVIMAVLFIIQIIVYLVSYDKSYYHIDKVREPMIRFLFFQSMLLGLYFRVNLRKFVNINNIRNWVYLLLSMLLYFVVKILFSSGTILSELQIINQLVIFVTLYFFFRCFAGIDKLLNNMPQPIIFAIKFISTITLEIYAVQYVIIPRLSSLIFPINWLVITIIIILAASTLRFVGSRVSHYIEQIINRVILMLSGGAK